MRIFISYNRTNMDAAQKVAGLLTARGAQVFIDYQNMTAGESFLARIGREIRECDRLLLLFSAQAGASRYVADEVEAARIDEKPILVLRLDDSPMPDAFFFLKAREYIRGHSLLAGGDLVPGDLAKLLRALGLPHDAPAPPPSASAAPPAPTIAISALLPPPFA
jgi:hypothetical protein